jgi:hypothetical protein
MSSRKSSSSRSSENTNPTQNFINALIPDLPLLMYGSGDVHPTQTNPATVELIATLTAQYVEKLVYAAVDAQDILTDGAGGNLPKQVFQKRKREDDWSQDLPMPKIRSELNLEREGGKRASADPDNLAAAPLEDCDSENGEYVKGLDIYPNRIREPHSDIPSTIGAQSFVFPICHDAEMYSKVQENKTFKAQLDETLVDSTVMDFIKEEEEGLEHLANSVFHWVSVGDKEDASASAAAAAVPNAADDKKLKNEKDIARRKEMARRLVARRGLDVQIPGVQDLLPPTHST